MQHLPSRRHEIPTARTDLGYQLLLPGESTFEADVIIGPSSTTGTPAVGPWIWQRPAGTGVAAPCPVCLGEADRTAASAGAAGPARWDPLPQLVDRPLLLDGEFREADRHPTHFVVLDTRQRMGWNARPTRCERGPVGQPRALPVRVVFCLARITSWACPVTTWSRPCWTARSELSGGIRTRGAEQSSIYRRGAPTLASTLLG